MLKSYIHLLLSIFALLLIAGCREDDFGLQDTVRGKDIPVDLVIDISDSPATRGIMEESKTAFYTDELIHVRAVYNCVSNGVESTKTQYGVLKYNGHGKWNPYDSSHALTWPDDAVSGSFSAYYIEGSTGVLSSNTMPAKLLSDYKYSEVPLFAEIKDVKYGAAVKLGMRHIFSYLTLVDIQEGISDELWFAVPTDYTNRDAKLNNAFRLNFNPETYEMTQEFLQIPNSDYIDGNGDELVYIKSKLSEEENDGNVSTSVSFFLQPGVYHRFNILYPRSRDTYATYLTYDRDLEQVTGPQGLLPNGRYVFSILKSLGVIVQETPEDGWDNKEPAVNIDVEKFLRAVNSGSDYFETDEETGEDVQILESTIEGTRLLRNVDFQYFYYDIFEVGDFKPVLNNTFDGNYHYIYHMGCPLFYQNDGIITNLGIRDAKTLTPVISSEGLIRYGKPVDTSYNGIITSRNYGTVNNMRVINVEMTVYIQTSDIYDRTQEAHNEGILFGVNRGNVYDVAISGDLKLFVTNAPGEDVIPRITIGGVAGQNLGTVSGISYIDDSAFEAPFINIINNCRGANGAYKVGGIAGNNTGTLTDIFVPSVTVDATGSSGLESYLGGMVGESPSSNSGAAQISGCIVRGEVKAGNISSLLNLNSLSYVGGVAGSLNIQANISDCSVSVGVTGSQNYDETVEYAEGGAFGVLQRSLGTAEGEIQTLACFGSTLSGNGYVGNFAGIVPSGFGWEHYADNQITIKQFVDKNVGLER